MLFYQELEESTVRSVQTTFQELYVPPLGPMDDPPGAVYLDGNLREKTVDTGVLEIVGKGVRKARKNLFDVGTRRRSLIEEMRAQKRRVSQDHEIILLCALNRSDVCCCLSGVARTN